MQLPFTGEQFFDLFVAYNEALWLAVVALWIASTVVVALRLSARHHHDRRVSALLVAHWAWSALAYHVAFFTRINPAAWLFAALFLAQAVLVFRVGRKAPLAFRWGLGLESPVETRWDQHRFPEPTFSEARSTCRSSKS